MKNLLFVNHYRLIPFQILIEFEKSKSFIDTGSIKNVHVYEFFFRSPFLEFIENETCKS